MRQPLIPHFSMLRIAYLTSIGYFEPEALAFNTDKSCLVQYLPPVWVEPPIKSFGLKGCSHIPKDTVEVFSDGAYRQSKRPTMAWAFTIPRLNISESGRVNPSNRVGGSSSRAELYAFLQAVRFVSKLLPEFKNCDFAFHVDDNSIPEHMSYIAPIGLFNIDRSPLEFLTVLKELWVPQNMRVTWVPNRHHGMVEVDALCTKQLW